MPPKTEPNSARAFAVCRDGERLPDALRGAVVAIGNFDGVHRGHQVLLEAAIGEARRQGAPALVLTFEPHPREFFAPQKPLFRLTPEAAKLAIFDRLGMDGAVVRRFDAALAGTSARDFVGLLAGELGAAGVVVGHDFHFGKGREGNPALLEALARELGLQSLIVPQVSLAGEPVSSSAIRAALEAGDIARANALLGYRWFVQGEVRHGEKRGRTLGFPTANIRLPENCRLRHGIYAVRAALGAGEMRDGVASFGRRPTFDNGAPLLEVFLFDFSGDLYGRLIEVELVGWIRAEERFPSADALMARMNEDAGTARRMLAQAERGNAASLIGKLRPRPYPVA